MFRTLFLACGFVTLAVFCGCETDELHPADCGRPCYPGPAKEVGVGICRAGRTVCDNGLIVDCVGPVTPQDEACNNTDEDCDTFVDDGLVRPCGSAYGSGVEMCENGVWVRCTAPTPHPETCNGSDDDLNGVIDDGIPAGNPCYEGDLEELRWARTGCHAGVQLCDRGRIACRNQQRPVPEICGNGIDDDCDGLVDEADSGTPQNKPVDIVLVVDRSGSMSNKLALVAIALTDFFSVHQSPQYMYAFVDVPGINTASPVVHSDFVDHVQAATVAADLTMTYGGIEASYDAFAEIGYGTLKSLSWRPGSYKLVFWFGDEEGQTNANWNEASAARALAQAGIVFFGFTLLSWAEDYDDIATATGGMMFDLLLSLEELRRIIFESIVPTCIGGG